MTATSSHLQVETRDGVRRVTFTRPEAFNAMSEEMAVGLVEALRGAAEDDDVRVVLLTGTGAAFNTCRTSSVRTLRGGSSRVRARRAARFRARAFEE